MVDSLDGTEGVEIWNWLYKPSNSIYQMDVLSSPEKDYQVLHWQEFPEQKTIESQLID